MNGAAPCHRSSPVCRINEKLANTAFASYFFAQNHGLPLILTLIDVYGSAKALSALFARRAMIPFAGVLRSVRSFLPKKEKCSPLYELQQGALLHALGIEQSEVAGYIEQHI